MEINSLSNLTKCCRKEPFFVLLLYIQQSQEKVFILSNLMNITQGRIYKLGLKAKQLIQNTGFRVLIIHWLSLKARFQLSFLENLLQFLMVSCRQQKSTDV